MHIKYGDPCQRRFRELAVHSCWFLGAVHHVGRDCCVVLDQRLRYVFGVQMNKRKHEITGIGLSILLCKNKNPVAKVFGADMMLLTALSQTPWEVWRGTPPFPSLLMPPLTQNPVSAPGNPPPLIRHTAVCGPFNVGH